MERYDVVIVGAGLAGLQCARLLGSQGVRVLLADRKPSLTESIHTTGIFVRRTLEDFDLPEECLGPVVRHVTLYSPARRAMTLESPHDEFRVGRMGPLYTWFLQECRRVGVDWRPGTSYAGCTAIEDGSIIRFARGDRTWQVQARYVVGADGARSQVARDLGLDVNREWIVGVEDVFRRVPLNGPPRFLCFLDPALAPGYIAWVVNDGEEVHLGVGGYHSRFDPPRALEMFRTSVRDIVDLTQAKFIEHRGGRIPVSGVLRRLANQQGLIVGDAAGAPSPLSAGGLDPCLRLSSLAAAVIGEFLKTGAPEALSPYAGQRFQSRFISRRWMRRMIATIRQPIFLELICAGLRLPFFQPIAWHVFFGRGSFPDVDLELATQPPT